MRKTTYILVLTVYSLLGFSQKEIGLDAGILIPYGARFPEIPKQICLTYTKKYNQYYLGCDLDQLKPTIIGFVGGYKRIFNERHKKNYFYCDFNAEYIQYTVNNILPQKYYYTYPNPITQFVYLRTRSFFLGNYWGVNLRIFRFMSFYIELGGGLNAFEEHYKDPYNNFVAMGQYIPGKQAIISTFGGKFGLSFTLYKK